MSSSAPAAKTQLIAVAQAALPANFDVKLDTVFGPYVTPQALRLTGVRFSQDAYAELGPTYRHEEHYNISCFLCSTAGDADQDSRMTEVYGLYQSIQIAVANNPTLNGAVRLAWCRQLAYAPNHDSKGLSVGTLTFEVECQARVTSLS